MRVAEHKNKLGWRKRIDFLILGLTKRAKERNDGRFLRLVGGHLSALSEELYNQADSMPHNLIATPVMRATIAKIKPLLDEDPDMPTREIVRRSGTSFASIVKYRKLYREKRGLPPLTRGRKKTK